MAPTIRWVKWTVVTAVIAGCLGFGATQAFATSATLGDCPGSSIGACTSQEQCDAACRDQFPGSIADCQQPSGCCFCLQ